MRTLKPFILIAIVGTLIALGVWVFVRETTEEVVEDPSIERRPFLSFFGDRLGFTDSDETPGTTSDEQPQIERLSFREQLARAKILPLSDELVTGSTFTITSTTTEEGEVLTEEFVRFVERESGNVQDLSLDTGLMRRLTNTTVPGIQEALWGPNGSSVALRYLAEDNETIETFVAPLSTDWNATTSDLTGTFFPQNIRTISMSPVSSEVFYMIETPDRAVGYITDLSDGNPSTAFSSPLREWGGSWTIPESILVFSRPSSGSVGVVDLVSRGGGTSRVVSGTGVTALPNPSSSHVLYAFSTTNGLDLFLLDRTNQDITDISLATLPEKCVWASNTRAICAVPNTLARNLPDAWYQGRVSFTDTLWEIDTQTGFVSFLYAPEDTDANVSMDIIELAVSDDGQTLSFVNKKDLRAWVADVSLNTERSL